MTVTATPHSIQDAYPLAALQAGMLYHSGYEEDSATYHDVLTLTLDGEFDEGALRGALTQLAARHAVLRTSFDVSTYSQPMQLVHQAARVPLEVEDLTALGPESAAAHVSQWASQERRRGFDWATPPLLRAHAHLLGPRSFALSLSFHHAILDGWSVATLVTELLRRYVAVLDGTALPADPPESAYRDFVAAEIKAAGSPHTREYWHEILGDAPLTRIPREYRAHAGHGAEPERVASCDWVIDPTLADRLSEVASELRVPLRTVLLAAHVRVTALLTGDCDVLTGLLVNGRMESEAGAEVLGLFLNTVPLRVRLGRDTWATLISRVFEAETALLPHRHYPLFELQRLAGRSPLFDVVFDYRDFHAYRDLPEERRLRIVERRHRESTDVPLCVSFVRNQRDGRLHQYLSYQRAEFGETGIGRIRRQYLRALTDIAADHGAPAWSNTPYLAEGRSVNHGEQAGYGRRTLPELVLASAAAYPHAPAVIDGEQRLSYAELIDRAGGIASLLSAAGAGPESVVAVHVPRSVDYAVSVLGVLLAGAAVVPLEVDYPTDRLRHALADSGAAILVTTSRSQAELLGHSGAVILAGTGGLAAGLPAARTGGVRPDSLAYVLYTSGSTGRPKGVMLSHAALANFFLWTVRSMNLGPADRVAQRSPAGFDASLFELMIAWCSGAAAVIVPTGIVADPDLLAGRLDAASVTFLLLMPALLALHIEAGTFRRCPTLRIVACAGEALPQALVDALAAQSGAQLVNLYGPTEAGIGASGLWSREGAPWPTVPIGQACANVQLYVLDEHEQVQPPGAPGELCIGGAQLARGYLGAPALTAERFVPDHLSGAAGARLYRTGDRVRMLPGGDIEFLGRLDAQMKINGVRVEPTEIEAILHEHRMVSNAAVTVPGSEQGPPALVAYLVPAPGADQEDRLVAQLRGFLRERLPGAMIPSRFVVLDRLPFLPNGKLDRAALPAPPASASGTDPAGPRDQVEAKLVELWQELLGIDVVGVHDDFFALGGHSLLALRLAAQIRQEFARPLPTGTILAAPTVAELAGVLRTPEALAPAGPLVSLGGSGPRMPLFLMHGLGGHVFRFQPLARRLRDGGPVYAMTARGILAGERPHTALADMAGEYADRIRAARPHGPYAVGGFCIGGNIALEVARRLRAAGEDVPLVAMFWSNAIQPVLAESLDDEATLMMHALAGRELDVDRAQLRGRSADEQLAIIIEAAGQAKRLAPAAADPGYARRLLDVYRANAHAVASHRHAPYDGDVALFMPGDDPALAGIGSAGWESVVRGRLHVVPIPGNRSTSVREPLAAHTASLLASLLDRR